MVIKHKNRHLIFNVILIHPELSSFVQQTLKKKEKETHAPHVHNMNQSKGRAHEREIGRIKIQHAHIRTN